MKRLFRHADGRTEQITPKHVSGARSTEPERLRQRLRGDLDTIVAKALQKQPERRYPSAAALCEDLQRHLEGLPIRARPDTAGYRARKWVGRQLQRPVRAGIVGLSAVGLLLLAALAGAEGWLSADAPVPEPPLSANGTIEVAVLPFAVHGSPELTYLGEGISQMLSRALDGAGRLRSVDPSVLLRSGQEGGVRPMDPDRARAAAEQLGAEMYVLGDVREAGGELRVVATLYDRQRAAQPIARAETSGRAASLPELVDRVAAELLAEPLRGPGERLTRTAAATTNSLPALKGYLEGEAHLRAARYAEAVGAFRTAIAADTAFALAYYRLSYAATSAGPNDLMHRAADAALRHSGRLSEHDRLLVEAFHARLNGATERAQEVYRQLVLRYPNDLEAQFQLADILYHLNPFRGRSVREARPGLELALAFEPLVTEAGHHLINVLALERDRPGFEELQRSLRLEHPRPNLLFLARLHHAAIWGDAGERDSALAEMRTASDLSSVTMTWWVGTFSRNIPATQRLAEAVAHPSRNPEIRAWGYLTLADLALAQGQWKDAQSELARASQLAPRRALELHALYAALPFVPVPRAELIAVRDSLERWDEAHGPPPTTPPFGGPEADVKAFWTPRLYLLGLLNARLGDADAALRYAAALDTYQGHPNVRSFAHDLARGVRARVAREQSRPAEALAHLEQIRLQWPKDYTPVHFNTVGPERFLRAQLLQQLGREREALDWYNSLPELAIADFIYLAPSHFHQAEIHERLGNPQQAIEHYTRFVELWKNCDPELRPLREEAERRLARLRRAESN